MNVRFDPTKMRKLLQTALPETTATGAGDDVQAQWLYIPDRHARALSKNVAIVRGIRGAGKTLWWKALQDSTLRERVAERSNSLDFLKSARVTSGFGLDKSESYPTQRVISSLLADGVEAQDIWRTIVLWQVTSELPPLSDWKRRVRWTKSEVEESERLLRKADTALHESGRDHIVLFDALDRAGKTWPEVRDMLRGLLEVLLELRELRRVRGKAFLRPEMLDHASITSFRDASKLLNDAADLEWRPTDLYGLLWQRLGNAGTPSSLFRSEFEKLPETRWNQSGGVWVVPDRLRRDVVLQESILTAIAGKYMGANHRRGKVYTWLPDHLGDARRQVSPRSFLVALRHAADAISPKPVSSATAIDHHGVREGVARASTVRKTEIVEDLPWVERAIAPLEDMSVPAEPREITVRWQKAKLMTQFSSGAGRVSKDAIEIPRHLDEGLPGIMRELEEIGIFGKSVDGRVQMPDVYRIAFRLKRKGGVPPVKR